MFLKKQIDTLFLPLVKYWMIVLCVFLISLSILALSIFIGLKYHKDLSFIVGALFFMALLIFVRLKINLITKKATIIFSEEFIEITTSDTLNEKLIYSEIKYFSISKYASDHSSTIKFILRNKVKKRYIFFKQLDNNENILNNVLFYFSSYNINKPQEAKIQVQPSFYGTKQGRLFVAVTGFLILFFIIMQVIYKPKTIPISLFAVLGAYLQIKAIQTNNEKILKKFQGGN